MVRVQGASNWKRKEKKTPNKQDINKALQLTTGHGSNFLTDCWTISEHPQDPGDPSLILITICHHTLKDHTIES